MQYIKGEKNILKEIQKAINLPKVENVPSRSVEIKNEDSLNDIEAQKKNKDSYFDKKSFPGEVSRY